MLNNWLTNMGTNKLLEKLDDFLDLPKKKQQKKRDKLIKIIHKLEEKKAAAMQELAKQSELDETSDSYQKLQKEIKTISKLLKKAHKNSHIDDPEQPS